MSAQQAVDEIQNLTQPEMREVARQVTPQMLEALSPAELRKAGAQAGLVIGVPEGRTRAFVWIALICILGVVVLAGGFLVYRMILTGNEADVLVGFVSAALGALIGLLAPAPSGGATTSP